MTRCEQAGCQRWTHVRWCPEHAGEQQRALAGRRSRLLLEIDLLRCEGEQVDRERWPSIRHAIELLQDELAEVDDRLGIRRT